MISLSRRDAVVSGRDDDFFFAGRDGVVQKSLQIEVGCCKRKREENGVHIGAICSVPVTQRRDRDVPEMFRRVKVHGPSSF
jgi:hypothetical protein